MHSQQRVIKAEYDDFQYTYTYNENGELVGQSSAKKRRQESFWVRAKRLLVNIVFFATELTVALTAALRLKQISKLLLWFLLLCAIITLLTWAIFPDLSPDQIGLKEKKYTLGTNEVLEPAKTLWDWLGLVLVPAVIAFGVWWLDNSGKKNDREIADARLKSEQKTAENTQQEQNLQTFFDKMTELLLNVYLRNPQVGDKTSSLSMTKELRSLAKTRTLTTLRLLNGTRKGILLQFLYEADLINNQRVVELERADFRNVRLHEAILKGANLGGVYLNGANLIGTDLSEANLSNADLSEAYLTDAKLIKANLKNAILYNACLSGADLSDADLSEAHLSKTNFSCAKLIGANLHNTTMSVYAPGVDLTKTDLSGVTIATTNFIEATLKEANLSGAKLWGVGLILADLTGANLEGVELVTVTINETKFVCNLTGAQVTAEQLAQTSDIDGETIMPDGTTYKDWTSKQPRAN